MNNICSTSSLVVIMGQITWRGFSYWCHYLRDQGVWHSLACWQGGRCEAKCTPNGKDDLAVKDKGLDGLWCKAFQ